MARVLLAVLAVVTLPVLCWAAAARTRAGRWAGAVPLGLLGAGVLGLLVWPDHDTLILLAAYPVAAAVVMGVVMLVEWRRPGGSPVARGVVLGWLGVVVCGCPVTTFLIIDPEFADAPPAAEVLPPPEGFVVTADETLCASGGCWRELVLTGPGLPAEQAAAVRRHLETGHGWSPDGWSPPDERGRWEQCRRAWWRIDLGSLCMGVRPVAGGTLLSVANRGI